MPYCPTLIRQVSVADDILHKIQYPHVSNPHVEKAKQADAGEDEGEDEEDEGDSTDSGEMEQGNYTYDFFDQL